MSTGSIVVRRSLGRRLKAYRVQARKTVADVAAASIASKAKLARIEAGQTPVKVSDVRALCWLYGVDAETTEALVAMALNTNQEGWWESYREVVTPSFATYVELESAASEIQYYDPELVFGLLQTPEYTRAICQADPEMEPAQVEPTVALRAQRQRAAFGRQYPLRVTAILGAGVLAREIGGTELMAAQRARLLAATVEPHINLRVLPWSGGAHAAMQGAFTILRFDVDDHPDVVYLETRAGGRYITDEDPVTDYGRLFRRVLGQTQPIEEYLQ